MAAIPKGYGYVEFEIADQQQWETYRPLAAASLADFGGRYIVRGGEPRALESVRNDRGVVILEFESRERANEWYHSQQCQAPETIRLAAGKVTLVLLSDQEDT